MSEYDQIFGSISRAKPINNFASRLGPGKHTVALKRYQVKQSQKGQGPILEADFTVLASNTHLPGETRGWAWFIGSQGWAGAYEEARAKDFIAVVGKCIGDTSDVATIGAALAGQAQPGRGISIEVEIQAQTNRDGSSKTNAKGEVYTNATWMPIAQDGATIAQVRAQLDHYESNPVQAPVTTPSAPAPSGLAGALGGSGAAAPAPAGGTPLSALLTGLRR